MPEFADIFPGHCDLWVHLFIVGDQDEGIIIHVVDPFDHYLRLGDNDMSVVVTRVFPVFRLNAVTDYLHAVLDGRIHAIAFDIEVAVFIALVWQSRYV